jgi:hypothetical protein
MLAAVFMLSACAAPNVAETPAPTNDDAAAALQDEVEALTGQVEQLQDKVEQLEQENQLLQSDSTVSASEDLAYLLKQISDSGQTLTSFPALIFSIRPAGDGFSLKIDRQNINPGFEIGGAGEENYLIDDNTADPEYVYADRFTYIHYGGYLLPELDLSFGDYIAGSEEAGVPFTVYMLGDQAIYLDEILVP